MEAVRQTQAAFARQKKNADVPIDPSTWVLSMLADVANGKNELIIEHVNLQVLNLCMPNSAAKE